MGKVKKVKAPIPYTIEGLAVALGISRQTLLNYKVEKGYEPYFDIIKEYKDKILNNLAERALMLETNSPFTMFLLKNNYGFEDKKQHEVKGEQIIIERPQRPDGGQS